MHLSEFIWIRGNPTNFIWMFMNLHEYQHDFCFQIIWFVPNLYEFIQICFELIWKYAHCRTAAHFRTAEQQHTAEHGRALCRTLPHNAWIQMPRSCALHTAHLKSQSHTTINMNQNNVVWMCMHLHEFTWISVNLSEFRWFKTILFLCLWIYMDINTIFYYY
jgi:hypothetical protein